MSQFDCCQLQLVYVTREQQPVRNFQQKTLKITFDTFNRSQHLLHTLHKSFFVFQLCFYLSWNNKARYTKNVAWFLPSSPLKWLHKNSPILVGFFKCMLIWQLTQYNLTKLFQMELKAAKHYWSHSTEKNGMNFLANPMFRSGLNILFY